MRAGLFRIFPQCHHRQVWVCSNTCKTLRKHAEWMKTGHPWGVMWGLKLREMCDWMRGDFMTEIGTTKAVFFVGDAVKIFVNLVLQTRSHQSPDRRREEPIKHWNRCQSILLTWNKHIFPSKIMDSACGAQSRIHFKNTTAMFPLRNPNPNT